MVGYNSSKNDLNIIKKYFITHIGAEKQVTMAKKQGRIMFLSTPFHPQISSFRTFVIIQGAKHELWEVGENVWKQPDKIMAAIWVA